MPERSYYAYKKMDRDSRKARRRGPRAERHRAERLSREDEAILHAFARWLEDQEQATQRTAERAWKGNPASKPRWALYYRGRFKGYFEKLSNAKAAAGRREWGLTLHVGRKSTYDSGAWVIYRTSGSDGRSVVR